ncbi:MAG: hypothetical protein WDA74_10830, partial [Spirochaetota bacterium]
IICCCLFREGNEPGFADCGPMPQACHVEQRKPTNWLMENLGLLSIIQVIPGEKVVWCMARTMPGKIYMSFVEWVMIRYGL